MYSSKAGIRWKLELMDADQDSGESSEYWWRAANNGQLGFGGGDPLAKGNGDNGIHNRKHLRQI
jgi:hypothetical protein